MNNLGIALLSWNWKRLKRLPVVLMFFLVNGQQQWAKTTRSTEKLSNPDPSHAEESR